MLIHYLLQKFLHENGENFIIQNNIFSSIIKIFFPAINENVINKILNEIPVSINVHKFRRTHSFSLLQVS